MSYIAKPGSMVAHIFHESGEHFVGDRMVRTLDALCPAVFPEPRETAYFIGTLQIGRRRRRVCQHCARIARRQALTLLRDAAGDRP